MELKISRWIFFGVIVSSFFVQIFGVHVGGPWVLFEIFMILDLPNILQRSDLSSFLPILFIVIGQILFLLGWRTVKGYKLWLFMLSPLFVLIPLLFMLSTLESSQKETTLSAIPFFVMIVVFYVECFFKLKRNTNNHLNQ
ncbi:hypothetical protein IMCC3317_15940 [Kordia antarctica]|uniref:Uncharacterized protein n=1 Tax=Kordia antarctica TaxID=1218801 RepID=A0A7L4ZI03_9FLAO|nr:hypothetical protein [Kordia antarctica]QHI36235.1 hypothetical protein IMCC3317_15940 [Kordia antarctica]